LVFEPNLGQTDPSAAYLARGAGYQLYVGATGALTFSLPRANDPTTRDAFRMSFQGANASPQITAEQDTPGRSNYFRSGTVRTDVPCYAQVTVHNIYTGVDLILHGAGGGQPFEFDLSLQPGAAPSAIGLAFAGLQSVTPDGQGGMTLQTAGGTL